MEITSSRTPLASSIITDFVTFFLLSFLSLAVQQASLASANTVRQAYEYRFQQLPESYVSSSGSYRYPFQNRL